jgi:hypothetical protein
MQLSQEQLVKSIEGLRSHRSVFFCFRLVRPDRKKGVGSWRIRGYGGGNGKEFWWKSRGNPGKEKQWKSMFGGIPREFRVVGLSRFDDKLHTGKTTGKGNTDRKERARRGRGESRDRISFGQPGGYRDPVSKGTHSGPRRRSAGRKCAFLCVFGRFGGEKGLFLACLLSKTPSNPRIFSRQDTPDGLPSSIQDAMGQRVRARENGAVQNRSFGRSSARTLKFGIFRAPCPIVPPRAANSAHWCGLSRMATGGTKLARPETSDLLPWRAPKQRFGPYLSATRPVRWPFSPAFSRQPLLPTPPVTGRGIRSGTETGPRRQDREKHRKNTSCFSGCPRSPGRK